MAPLQAGQRSPDLGRSGEVSVSAIQRSMHSSCASRLHGHGFTHVALGVSESFCRQMKQTCWSFVAMGPGTMACADSAVPPSLVGVDIFSFGWGEERQGQEKPGRWTATRWLRGRPAPVVAESSASMLLVGSVYARAGLSEPLR